MLDLEDRPMTSMKMCTSDRFAWDARRAAPGPQAVESHDGDVYIRRHAGDAEALQPAQRVAVHTLYRAVKPPKLNRLRHMRRGDVRAAREIRDRPRHFQYAVIRARR
jgi:hypothetical protein